MGQKAALRLKMSKEWQKFGTESLFSRAISVFLTAVETRKFSLTAKKLGVTQSSVSQTIGLLESKLGFALFERDIRPLSPTKEAQELYKVIKSSDEEIRGILLRIQMKNWIKPAVRLGMIESVGRLLATDVCKLLRKKLGEISLYEGSSGFLLESVSSDNLDVAIIAGEEYPAEIYQEKVFEDPWFLIFPHNWMELKENFTWQDLRLCGLPLIYHSPDTADGKILHDYFLSRGLVFPKIFEVQSNDLIFDMVSKGLGWSLTHSFGLLGSPERTRTLHIKPAPADMDTRNLYLISHKKYPMELVDTVKGAIKAAYEINSEKRKRELLG